MPAYKDQKTGTWMSRYTYKTRDGEKKQSKKRGFKTKKEALEWEREFLLKKQGSNSMRFQDFVEVYKDDIGPRIKISTMMTKKSILETTIIPFFADFQLDEISTTDVMKWQNKMMREVDKSGKPYSKSYLKTIHNQLSAVLNHAVKYYGLKENPASKVGNMGSEKGIHMNYWTVDQYKKFSESMMDKPRSFYCFEILYWCGLRLGEMLALTKDDIDLEKHTLTVSKTYHRINREDVVTSPKTEKSNRTITIPEFLVEELQEYIDSCYDLGPDDRLFDFTKSYVERELARGIKEQNLNKIRVHDLRHSHVSLLIDMGYSAVSIADRMGHESIDITYRYAHMFPSVQKDMADKLNEIKGDY